MTGSPGPACWLLALLTVFMESAAAAKLGGRFVVRMEAYGNCPGVTSAPIYYTESGVRFNGITSVGWGVMNVTKDFQKFTRTVTHIVKCTDRSDPHCENWQVWTFGGPRTCSDVERRDLPWSPIFTAQPRFRCPLKKGIYRQQNATFDLDRMTLVDLGVLALAKDYWKIKMEVDMDNVKAFNICFEMSASRVRS